MVDKLTQQYQNHHSQLLRTHLSTYNSDEESLLQRDPELFQALLHKTNGSRSEWEYPFAAAGVNITFMLEEMLDLRSSGEVAPNTAAGRAFMPLLSVNTDAFDLVRSQKLYAMELGPSRIQTHCSMFA